MRGFLTKFKTDYVWTVLGILFAATLLSPIYFIAVFGFQNLEDLLRVPPVIIPRYLTIKPMIQAFNNLYPFMINSFINSFGCMILTLITAVPAAYGLAHFNLRFKGPYVTALAFTQMFPVVMLAIPIFLMYNRLGMINTRFGLIAANATYSIPFCTIVLYPFMSAVPFELIEAAFIDGGSQFWTFTRVALPLAKSGLATSAIYSFLFPWSDFIWALTVTTQEWVQPMSIALYKNIDQYGVRWNTLMAGGFLFSLPAIIVVVLAGRFIIGGLTAGALKQ